MATVYAEIGKTEYSGKHSDRVNTGQWKTLLLMHDIHQNSERVNLKSKWLYLRSVLESTQRWEDMD